MQKYTANKKSKWGRQKMEEEKKIRGQNIKWAGKRSSEYRKKKQRKWNLKKTLDDGNVNLKVL